jgi:hypothetical protein
MKSWQIGVLLLSLTYTTASHAQSCYNDIEADAPDSRYTLNQNGTLLDKQTGLMWMRCSLGQKWTANTCSGSASIYRWQSALQTAEKTVFAGKKDWRLPNQVELQSLVERRCVELTINTTAFPNTITDYRYWSSSPVFNESYSAWIVDFSNGIDSWDDKTTNNVVRLVRGGL